MIVKKVFGNGHIVFADDTFHIIHISSYITLLVDILQK